MVPPTSPPAPPRQRPEVVEVRDAPGPAEGWSGTTWRGVPGPNPLDLAASIPQDRGMIPATWLPTYRPEDLELIGYLAPAPDAVVPDAPEGEAVVPMTLLGTPLGEPMTVFAAEQTLELAGLGYLADRWLLRHDEGPSRGQEQEVVVVEVTPEAAVLANADYALVVGARIGEPIRIDLPTDRLRRR